MSEFNRGFLTCLAFITISLLLMGLGAYIVYKIDNIFGPDKPKPVPVPTRPQLKLITGNMEGQPDFDKEKWGEER